MVNFKPFGQAVHAQWEELAKDDVLFVVDTEDLFEKYLSYFPEGANPIFRERTEHDCSCCKQFVRNMGSVVALRGGQIHTIWDVSDLSEEYQAVADKMSTYVRSCQITNVFKTDISRHGAEQTIEYSDAGLLTWNHFYADVKPPHHTSSPSEERGQLNTSAQLLTRSVRELDIGAVRTVIELVRDGQLYRGEEHLESLTNFLSLMEELEGYPGDANLFGWENCRNPSARFRNTVIGTLICDLSSGTDLESAVALFEKKVAPENYRRRCRERLFGEDGLKEVVEAMNDSVFGDRSA